MNSALYVGKLSHARRRPRPHAFGYQLYMLYLDLDELPRLELGPLFGVERAALCSFRRRDYLGDAGVSLREAVLDRVQSALGERPDGALRMLSQVRTFGYVFNPVSFYYCFAKSGELRAVLAEITNTPWGERHAYVLRGDGQQASGSFAKSFHVSPFFPLAQRYHWSFSAPAATLDVQMTNEEDGREVFRAALALERQPLTGRTLSRALVAMPWMSARIHAAIYFQALLLWAKRTPFFPHPQRTL
jgi:DUF1365 family protein